MKPWYQYQVPGTGSWYLVPLIIGSTKVIENSLSGTRYQVLRVPGISVYMVRVYDAEFHRMHIAVPPVLVAPQQWNILPGKPGRYYDMNTDIARQLHITD